MKVMESIQLDWILSIVSSYLSFVVSDPRHNILLSASDNYRVAGALQQVSQAAAHANDSMKRIEQFKKLLEVQESIGGSIDLVSPTREVLKEGKIVKISARTADHQERYLFLVR